MFAIRTFAILGAVAGLFLGVPAHADDEDGGVKIEFKVMGIAEDDAESYANWLERENDGIESAKVDGETVTVHLEGGEELELLDLYEMTRSYAEDAEKKDEIEFDAGSVVLRGRARINLENVEDQDQLDELAKKIDEMDEMKAWTQDWSLGGQIWVETEDGEEIELRKVLEAISVESKLKAQFEAEDEEVEGLTLENVTWQPQLLD